MTILRPVTELLGLDVQPSITAWITGSRRSPSAESCIYPVYCSQLISLEHGYGVCDWLLGDISKSPSKSEVQSNISPSNKSPSKNRRQKGEGSGSIHWRTLTRNGKDYPQAYYHWKENGKKRTKYIPKQLLGVIQEAECDSRPVVEILELLGVAPRPSEHTLLGDIQISPSKDKEQLEISPSKKSSSKNRRRKGYGSGSIQWKTITRNGKDYPQAWYHYEFWEKGDRLVKRSKYIPQGLLSKVQKLNVEKAPVREILKLLGVTK